jgi:hypothetical protein
MLDTNRIMAARMANGEPIGDGWLYGRLACQLIASRLVNQATMERYRSAAFLDRRSTYGEAAALAWEADAKARHAEGRIMYQAQMRDERAKAARQVAREARMPHAD